ncbi:MAG: hypothetical protein AB1439_06015 [candidate division FCPU426 bacterium]
MADWLSPEERFQDHVEIVGYGTAGLAGIGLVVYFGAIFFYAPLLHASAAQHLGVLGLLASMLVFSLFIPRQANPARIFLRLLFIGLAFTASLRLAERLHWAWLLSGLYALYAAWVLGHPVAVRFFRPLRPAEQQRLPAAGWLAFHGLVLLLYLLGVAWRGWQRLLPESGDLAGETELAFLQVVGAMGLALLQIFLMQAHNWARWLLACVALAMGLAALPATMTGGLGDYWQYWQSLALAAYFLSLAAYLVLAPSARLVFAPQRKAA